MKPQELRIGNLLFDNIGNVTEVELIDKNDSINGYAGLSGYDPEEIKNFKPIPLTEYWLSKFSFETNGLCALRAGILIHIFGDNKMFIDTIEMKGNFKEKSRRIELKSVHQLQNLYFALTGEELKLSA